MIIVRDYKKSSKHEWWKIKLSAQYNDGYFLNNTLVQLNFVAYGFSSNCKQMKGIQKEYLIDEFTFIGSSKQEVISKEKELLQKYYDSILSI